MARTTDIRKVTVFPLKITIDISDLKPESRKRYLRDLRALLYNYASARGISAEEVRELAQECGYTSFSVEAYRVVRNEIDRRFGIETPVLKEQLQGLEMRRK